MEENPNTENEHFQPRKALFYVILSDDQNKNIKSVPSAYNRVDHLELFQNFQMAKLFVIDIQCLESFQRQVLAATAYPVLNVIATYVLIFNQMYYIEEKQHGHVSDRITFFGDEIDILGEKVYKLLNVFVELDIYPEKVKQHFEITHLEFGEFIQFPEKKSKPISTPKWIGKYLDGVHIL